MNKAFYNHIVFRLITPVLLGLVIYLMLLLLFNDLSSFSSIFNNKEAFLTIIIAFSVNEFMRFSFNRCTDLISFNGINFKKLIRLILLTFSVSISIVIIELSIYFYITFNRLLFSFELWSIVIAFILFIALLNLIFISYKYYITNNEYLILKEKKQKEQLLAEFQNFQNSYYPNVLNESLEILLSRPDKPVYEKIIQHLSSFYRYTLHSRNEEFVELKNEVQALQNFVELMNINLGIQIPDIQCKVPENKYILPLLLINFTSNLISNSILNNFSAFNLNLTCKDDSLVITCHRIQKIKGKNLDEYLHKKSKDIYTSFGKPIEFKSTEFETITIPLISLSNENTDI